jgi:hypothetical protein
MFPDILNDEDSLLMRWIDDPLLLTYDLELAKRYLTLMFQIDPVYNCDINVGKCVVNFDATVKGSVALNKMQKDEWIAWCGIFVNTRNFNVKYDYTTTKGMYFLPVLLSKRSESISKFTSLVSMIAKYFNITAKFH